MFIIWYIASYQWNPLTGPQDFPVPSTELGPEAQLIFLVVADIEERFETS